MTAQFNERLVELMEERGCTADALGKAIGVSGSIVSRWLRQNSSIRSENLVKLAHYFDCSLDYLCGLSKDEGHFIANAKTTFDKRLKQLISESGKSLYLIQKQTQLAHSGFYNWFKGTPPKLMSLVTLAQYFDCSIDYLVGRER